MPANIMSYVGRQSAWHNLGTVTGRFMTWEEVQSLGKLDYIVFKSQLRDGLGRPVDAWGTFRWTLDDRANGRKDAARFLGVVGEDYTVIQHAEGFRLMDALVASADGAHYETAGSLGNGETVWGLADLGLAIRVGDDKQQGYLLFCTGHDGSLSHQYRLTFVRVVCQNTLSMALSRHSAASLKVRHTKNAQARLDGIHETLASIQTDARTVEEKLQFLAKRKVTRESLDKIMDRLFPSRKDADGADLSSTRRENIMAEVLKLYELNDGAGGIQEHRGTAYNLLNAVTEYTDHYRSTRGANGQATKSRAESALFGSGDLLKRNALDAILEEAESMPEVAQPITVDWNALGLNVR